MRRISLALAAALIWMASCGRAPVAANSPVWAVQLPWAPAAYGLSLQYAGAAPFDGTSSVAAVPSWQSTTWELTAPAWSGRENFGADFRIAATAGVAIRQVTVGANPPGQGGPAASVTLPGPAGDGLTQVGAGGHTGDSLYNVATVAGQRAEVVGGPHSYLYFRLSRASPVRSAPTAYVTVSFAAPEAARPWSEATFARLAAEGIDRAEINLEWAAIEPGPGTFDFTVLDQDLANAARAGIQVIPIFWDAVWQGNPAYWATSRDVGSSGAASQIPAWWDPTDRQAYFGYVRATVAHIRASAGFGGAFLDYGWLDYMWGPPPGRTGVNGYAPADVARFHAWLPTAYGTLAAFNAAHHTAFASWAQVPAARPGQPLFSTYQRFRAWSVQETYGKLSALYRQLTQAPLYYYWGGGFAGAGAAMNLPDIFFQVARQYGATVVLDDANVSALPPLFHSLAQAYGVPLLEEWTPQKTGLGAEMAQFLGHYGFEGPKPAGLDFFIYGHRGFATYARWIPHLRKIRGAYPQQPVAVYISYAGILSDPNAIASAGPQLGALWQGQHIAFAVVTDREIAAGAVRLADFRAVYPLTGGSDPAIQAYARAGGHVLTSPAQMRAYAAPYARLDPNTAAVEVVPSVDAASRTAWLTVAAINPTTGYDGRLTIEPAGLGLPEGTYRLRDLTTGRPVPAASGAGGLTASLALAPGTLDLWQMVPATSGG